jgi:hypothetical protein
MSAVTTTLSSSTSVVASLSAYVTLPVATSDALSPAASSTGSDRGPATNVQLSETVKATLAKAKTDQVAADALQDFVTTHRVASNSGSQASSDSSKIDTAFAQLSGADASTAGDTGALAPVQVVRSFSTGLQSDGFTIAASANAHTGSSSIEIIWPNGFSFYDKHFGWSDEATGGLSGGPGLSEEEYQTGNVEYVTLSRASATATAVTASSGGNVASASTATAQSDSVTIAIDFTTGSVSLTHSKASLSSSTASVGQAKSPLSVLA